MKNAKVRILFIVTQAEWGGAQNYVFKAAGEALKRGHDVLVVAGGDGALESHCKNANIPYKKLQRLKREVRPIADIQALFECISLIKSWKPDVVFTFSAKAGVIGSFAARMTGVKRVIYRIGGWSWLDPVSNTQKWIRIWEERIAAPLKDVIIVQHPGDKELAQNCHIKPRKNIVVISNGLDVEMFDQALFSREKARGILETLRNGDTLNGPLIISICNFYGTKDIPNLLRAADIVRRQRPEVRFVVIGKTGDDESRIHQVQKDLHLEGIVALPTFPGSDSRAQTLLRGADLFVSSSAKEGNPWALHEAMAARLPCIATDVGACAWLLQNNAGWIVPPKNPEALAQAILYALDYPEEAKQRADQARRNVETLFTEKNMWEKTFEVINSKSSPGPSLIREG